MGRWIKQWDIPEDHWLRSDLRYIGAWYELLKMAEPTARKIVRNGKMIDTERGTVYTSLLELSKRWSVSRNWTRHFLDMLEADGMIERQQKDTKTTTLKVNNYAKYQDRQDNTRTPEGQQKDTTGTTEGQQKDNTRTAEGTFFLTNEEDKEYTEGTERESKRETARFTPPTLMEVLEYITEKGYAVDGRRFWEYYESVGWKVGKNKMKDWKAAVRSWNARDEQERKQRSAPQAGRFNNFEAREPGTSLMDDYIKLLEA